jgi:nucleotide-binding universal stress UspA family protein
MDTQRKILVAVDLLEGTTRVLETAFAIAAPIDARLIIMSVAEPPSLPASPMPFGVPQPPPRNPDYDLAQLQARLAPELTEMMRKNVFARTPVPEFMVAEGLPDTEIVRTAAQLDADLIVMGTHGRSGLKRMLLGSVAEKVVREAGCAVVVVREKHHNPDWKVPEIEPLCVDCATARAESGDATVWCARHAEHQHLHARGHAYSYSHVSDAEPHAPTSTTGS